MSLLSLIGETVSAIATGYTKDLLIKKANEFFLGASPLGTGFAVATRFREAVESAGLTEVEVLAKGLISELQPSLPPGAGTLLRVGGRLENFLEPGQFQRGYKWQKGGWAQSRQDWLLNNWRHNWLSQPRDSRGRWMPGRLNYPVTFSPPKISRKKKQMRRVRAAHKREIKNTVRGIFSSWGTS